VTAVPEQVVTEPGVYYDMPSAVYHAQHDWLSASMLKKLLPPKGTPEKLLYSLNEGETYSDEFDFGKAVHAVVLGAGEEIVLVDAASWLGKAAQQERKAIREAGKIPLLAKDKELVEHMAQRIREHDVANALLTQGEPEVSLFWVDAATGVQCRARIDWLCPKRDGRRRFIADLKTTRSAAPSEFAKQAKNLAYYAQQEHYLDGIRQLGLDDDPAWLYIVAEKEPPNPVIVAEFAEKADVLNARAAVDRARRIYAECVASGEWPGYPAGVVQLAYPYLERDLEEFLDDNH
jgi:hypothetical protein